MSGRKARQARQREAPPEPRWGALTERRLAYTAAAIAIVVVVVGGVTIANKKNGRSSAEALSALSGPVSRASGNVPVLHGTDPIDGKKVSLAEYTGKPIVLNVWASWCTGCNQEAADLARFAREHPNAQVFGVDTQDSTGGARAFYRKWHWHHPSVADPSGSLSDRLGVSGLPTTFFLDTKHHVVAKIIGAGNLGEFEQGFRVAQRSKS